MDFLKKYVETSKVYYEFQSGAHDFCIENEFAMAAFIKSVFESKKTDILIVTPSMNEAQLIYTQIIALGLKEDVLFYPGEEVIRLKKISMSKEIIGERIFTLSALAKNRGPKIVIANFHSAIRYTPTPKAFREAIFSLKKNQPFSLKQLKTKLIEAGYQKVEKITSSMQFASRGDIVDVFPINSRHPVRIDFFDDFIEEIREFRISNQKSFNTLEEVVIFPASEHLGAHKKLSMAYQRLDELFPAKELDQTKLKTQEKLLELLDDVDENHFPLGLEKFTKTLKIEENNVVDFLLRPLVFKYNKLMLENSHNSYLEKQKIYNSELILEAESIENLNSFFDLNQLENYQVFTTNNLNGLLPNLGTSYIRNPNIKSDENLEFLQQLLFDGYRVVIGALNDESVQLITASLERQKLMYSFDFHGKIPLIIQKTPLFTSFVIEPEKLVFLVENDVFYMKKPIPRFVSHYKEGSQIDSYLDLEIGDYIVHELYGVGRYKGLKTIEGMGITRDCLEVEYANENILYVPVLQIDYIRKYLGRDGYAPPLTRLHTKDWQRLKNKVKKEIDDNYQKLLELYQGRLQENGLVFVPVLEFENAIEKSCPFELTNDQERSLFEIFEDLGKPYPMDRLLCGDVGFGKTEVALRAASRVVSNGYQVCIICPTTILANQHFELFKNRLGPIGFNVGLLSRFVSKTKQKETIRDLGTGKVDVLIATHRAISQDVVFKNLGLLIIDEEQRFGVKQKEMIKMKHPYVDVLTLSATPIPRTLQMSLLNLRPVSRIDTPPPFRNPIQTYVVKDDDYLLKEIVEQELGRNGQVFYLSNRISGIEDKVQAIKNEIPAAKVGLIHGQMSANGVEDELFRFYSQETNVLVCTTIIENGIDYPNANTLIVENAQNFGLAQLYQIKGRVGRSDRIAYAYLMYDAKRLTDQGINRLKAIQQYTELGSGYKIAEQDLLIRGAGEIIGENQSGFISNVGLDMYTKLFNEVMFERKNNEEVKAPTRADLSLFDSVIKEIDTKDDEKIELYQRLSRVETFEEIETLRNALIDEFGRLPIGIENLIDKKTLDIYANMPPIKNITEEGDVSILTIEYNSLVILKSAIQSFDSTNMWFSRFNPGEIRIKKSEYYLKDLIKLVRMIVEEKERFEKAIYGDE